jgi:hypothetical protein
METPQGVVHGKIIELDSELGLPDGQRVALVVHPLKAASSGDSLSPGEGLRQAFGSWAEGGDELDEYLEWNRRQRKITRPEIKP